MHFNPFLEVVGASDVKIFVFILNDVNIIHDLSYGWDELPFFGLLGSRGEPLKNLVNDLSGNRVFLA